jgi:hypothetical protein
MNLTRLQFKKHTSISSGHDCCQWISEKEPYLACQWEKIHVISLHEDPIRSAAANACGNARTSPSIYYLTNSDCDHWQIWMLWTAQTAFSDILVGHMSRAKIEVNYYFRFQDESFCGVDVSPMSRAHWRILYSDYLQFRKILLIQPKKCDVEWHITPFAGIPCEINPHFISCERFTQSSKLRRHFISVKVKLWNSSICIDRRTDWDNNDHAIRWIMTGQIRLHSSRQTWVVPWNLYSIFQSFVASYNRNESWIQQNLLSRIIIFDSFGHSLQSSDWYLDNFL